VTTSETPESIVREARRHERAGRLAAAAAAYERLLARFPDRPDSWYNLGVLQRKLLRFDAALASYRQALDRGISEPEQVHLNRAVIYADRLRQEAEAARELEAALALNPNYLPALLNYANLNEDLGRRAEALALYERLLRLAPQHCEALARYASLRGVATPDDPLVARLAAARAAPGAGAADRASLGFALAKVLDACGAYPRAFAAAASANHDSRQSALPQPLVYDRVAQQRLVDRLIETFDGTGARAPATPATPAPIFICGMFRSGSTLVERVLAGHPRVTAGGELDLLPRLVQSELAPFPATVARLSAAALADLARRYRDELARLFPGAEFVTDKRPDNFLYLGLIKRLFPAARIIHTTRHPLDTCLSVFFLHLDHRMSYALDLLDTGHYYREYRRLMAHWQRLYGADILDFDYDAFVREPRPAVARLLEFCGLDGDERCLRLDRPDGVVKTASVWQVREPLYQRSSGRWRHYARELAPLREYLRDYCAERE
jgi:tetratricopeptide (TPR) repeat protein